MKTFVLTVSATLIAALVVFLCSILFKNRFVKIVEILKSKLPCKHERRVKVRMFFISCPQCKIDLKTLLLNQNDQQSLFEFEIQDWSGWHGHSSSEYNLGTIRTDKKLTFCNEFHKEILKYYMDKGIREDNSINIAITEINFPQNFYTWNTKDKKTIVIGIKSLAHIFQDDINLVNKMILRVVQRMTIYAQKIDELSVHSEIKGCLFDFTRELKNLSVSADNVRICSECENRIKKSKGTEYFQKIQKWLKRK